MGRLMHLRWLEDLVCVADEGHFARAAERRHITQSALSRRIKSLELWAGAELLDRSRHPIRLTDAGTEFVAAAHDIISQAYDARLSAEALSRESQDEVTIASLHTLALYFVPSLVSRLSRRIGAFPVSVVAETRTVEEYLSSLSEQRTDFFISYALPSDSEEIDTDAFEQKVIGRDRLVPYAHSSIEDPQLESPDGPPIPYVGYSGTAMMSYLVKELIQDAPFRSRLETRYRATLAESVRTAVSFGLGIAWLPESTVIAHGINPDLRRIAGPWQTEFEIKLFRSRNNTRPVVKRIWDAADAEE
ncbi:LysR family transcriptional regulator [Pseudoblastomonas halimionae]|uniref:LysR family transcriptional regulator n=1 Tax=Alteriqipengyuania halimionae TaxID=1926630 RepID=A0A6I4U1Y2_9SPHN|nr:LysR family transcriptional regulator [Alteriqipengyuania halimionae]MXP08945.1 LysR family transcriptional regulator [Alteriqipengyuania halimionae]